MRAAVRLLVGLLLLGRVSAALAQPCPTQLDDRWVVTVNGQTVRVNPDGSFRLPNISAADVIPRDFKSDDWFQVAGTATIDGVTCFASSPLFQIQSQADGTPVTFPVEDLTFSTQPPPSIWESIRIETVGDVYTLFVDGVGGPSEVELEVWAILGDGSEFKQPPGVDGTTYRTSNPAVANVVEVSGVVKVLATGFGTAYITVSNSGVTGVRGFVVTVPCLPTTLMGFVQLQDATPVAGASVSTDGGSGVTVANPAGQFSFDVCYTPTGPFSVVVEDTGSKAVLQDVTPIPNGVTDVGVITLEGQLVFWDFNGSGDWGEDLPGFPPANWHTGSIPNSASRVFINYEDRTSDPVFPYTVTMPPLSPDVTVAAFTLDSPSGMLTTQGSGTTFTVTGASQVLDGKVDWRSATWLGSTLTNNDEMVFSGPCAFSNGLNVTNNGAMLIEYDNDQGELLIDGTPATRFEQASTANELRIDGKMRILEGATLVTLPGSKGITLGATGLLDIGSVQETIFDHQGGLLTLGNVSPGPFGGNGLEVRVLGRFNINGGNVQIEPSGSLDVFGGVLTLTAGTINNAGRLEVSGAFIFLGGSIVGDGADGNGVIIDNGSLTIGPAVTSPVKFTMRRSCNLAAPNGSLLTLASGQTLVVQNDSAFIATFVNVTPGVNNNFTNNGTIVLDSLVGSLGSTLRIDNDGAIINNGSISVLPGTGGNRELDAKLLENYGTMTIAAPTDMRGPSDAVYRNHSSFSVAFGSSTIEGTSAVFEQAGGNLNVTPELGFVIQGGARFQFTGGQIQGQVVVQGATLEIAPSATGSGQFLMRGVTNLESDIGATHTLIVDGSLAGGGSATLNIPFESSLTNWGTLIIETPEALTSGAISLSQGQQFTNEFGASLDFNTGAGQNPSLGGKLYNKGTVNVRKSISLGNNNDAHTNTATGTFHMFNNAVVTIQRSNLVPFVNESDAQSAGVVAGVGTLNMINGYVGTFQNGGLVEPGGDQTAGTLTVAGHYTQTTTGALDIELGGTAPGQFDVLAVSNNATLAGTINISLLPGYTPAVGDSFTIMTFATRSGDFTTYTGLNLGNGLALQPMLTTTSLTFTVIQPSPAPQQPPDTNKRTRPRSRR